MATPDFPAYRLRSESLTRTDSAGRPLYCITSSGNIRRTRKVSPRVRQLVVERDGRRCVQCGGTQGGLEVDHIVRYADGGSNAPENLRTLCHDCHVSRGDT